MTHSNDAATLVFAVPFRDVDMHGHMHNAVHLSHFEAAINHLIEVRDWSAYFGPKAAQVYLVRKAEVVFERPSKFRDLVSITMAPARIGRTSVTFEGAMRGADNAARATAQIVWVCVEAETGQSCPIPDATRNVLTG